VNPVPVTPDEPERIKALESYHILDTLEQATYDAFTQLAREIAGTRIATIGLIDHDRVWFKSCPGLAQGEVAREVALCSRVVETREPLIVPDARSDERFKDNPLVTGEPFIRFYAGVPLITPEGHAIGTLCVIDDKPGTLSSHQLESLKGVAKALISLLEGRRRFLGLLDVAQVDIFVVESSNLTLAFASNGACARLGSSRRELLGNPIALIMPGMPEEVLRDCAARAAAGEAIVREAELRRRDGSTYSIELRLDVTREPGEERILMTATDLTQRKAHEREITLLLEAINVAGDVILVYRVKKNGELELHYMNDAYVGQTGYTREEAIGRTLDEFRQSMPDDEGMRLVRAALRDAVPTQSEIVSYRKDGSTYWNQVTLHPICDPSGATMYWIAIERDITDDVHRAATLAEEHDRLLALNRAARRLFTPLETRSLIETVREVVRELLRGHARVLAVGEDGRAIEVQELGVADWTDAFDDDLVRDAVHYQMRVVSEGSDRACAYTGRFGDAAYVLELRARSSYTIRDIDLFVFDLISEYFAVAARNVTLYHELEERRSAVLELSQTKSDLITMLAHDFRGPLTSIVGFADLTSEVGEVNGEQSEFLETIKQSALQLSDLATDTLTLSRLERNEVTLQIGHVDVEALLRSIITQQSDRRTIALEVQGDGRVLGDEERLRQVFSNVLDNAIKYSPGGESPDVRLTGSDETVTVTVHDRGIGIPAGELSGVFDRFSRASNARKMRIVGTGFGLFLTKQLVQLHGGTIAVESTEGKGSAFTVMLPRRVDRNAAPRTIVVLDPERDRSFIVHGLREAGYRVVAAGSVEEVFGIADAESIDALVLATPEDEQKNPHAAQFRVLSRERQIPLIAIANQPSSRLGAAITLARPVLVGDVVLALENILGARR
jgi:PAS domain S-box-containing protein